MKMTRSNLSAAVPRHDRHQPVFDVDPRLLRGKLRLPQIVRVRVDAEYASGIATFHLLRVEPRIAADVEDAPSFEVLRHDMPEGLPLHCGIVAEEVTGRCLDAPDPHVVEPGTERRNLLRDDRSVFRLLNHDHRS